MRVQPLMVQQVTFEDRCAGVSQSDRDGQSPLTGGELNLSDGGPGPLRVTPMVAATASGSSAVTTCWAGAVGQPVRFGYPGDDRRGDHGKASVRRLPVLAGFGRRWSACAIRWPGPSHVPGVVGFIALICRGSRSGSRSGRHVGRSLGSITGWGTEDPAVSLPSPACTARKATASSASRVLDGCKLDTAGSRRAHARPAGGRRRRG